MNYRERLLDELENLTIKIDRLERYIKEQTESDIVVDLDFESKQLEAMTVYRHWLEQRILKLMK